MLKEKKVSKEIPFSNKFLLNVLNNNNNYNNDFKIV
jgi:hypothetical protein